MAAVPVPVPVPPHFAVHTTCAVVPPAAGFLRAMLEGCIRRTERVRRTVQAFGVQLHNAITHTLQDPANAVHQYVHAGSTDGDPEPSPTPDKFWFTKVPHIVRSNIDVGDTDPVAEVFTPKVSKVTGEYYVAVKVFDTGGDEELPHVRSVVQQYVQRVVLPDFVDAGYALHTGTKSDATVYFLFLSPTW